MTEAHHDSIGEAIAGRAAVDAEGLDRDGIWSESDDRRLDALFESAATRALRVPAIAERSRFLRKVGKRVVPPGLRPALRRVVVAVDHLVGRLHSMSTSGR